MRPRISIRGLVRPLVRPLVGWSVCRSVTLLSIKNGHLRILNDLDNAGRGGRRDEGEGGARRKEGQGGTRSKDGRGGRSDVESGEMKKL